MGPKEVDADFVDVCGTVLCFTYLDDRLRGGTFRFLRS